MGYWGYHPMEGDTPLDNLAVVEDWLLKTLIEDIQTEESSGKNEKISDKLRNFVIERSFNEEKITEDLFYPMNKNDINYSFGLKVDLWNTYKYDLINNFKDEETDYDKDTYFVIPFKFIDFDVHIKSEYIPYLIEMLGDGGSYTRDYNIFKDDDGKYTLEDFKEDHDHPYYYVLLVQKYATQLFDENNKELDDEFVSKHPEITNIVSKGLFETMFEVVKEAEENGVSPSLINIQ